MIQVIQSKNGRYAGYAVAEIISVPFYELIDKDIDRANYMNQVFASNLLSGLHRRATKDTSAYELLYVSMGVSNQTYKSQVRIFLVVRQIGESELQVRQGINDTIQSLKNDFTENNFSFELLATMEEYHELNRLLSNIETSSVLAISKKEDAITNTMSAYGFTYYTDVVTPSEQINTTRITNTLTQYPDCAISIQIIPTVFNKEELIAIEEMKRFLGYYASNVRYKQGLSIDTTTQTMINAYDYYSDAARDYLFYYNLLIYAKPSQAFELANRVMNTMESIDKSSGSKLEIVDISATGLKPDRNFALAPWAVSNILVHDQRDNVFWRLKTAPEVLKRLKFLMTIKEIRTVFKMPIDDGKAVGLDSRKVLANREKLHRSVISEENFKVGLIQNASRTDNGQAVHASIALDDFTMHGLVVGMPGSGKTNFSMDLLLQFWKGPRIPFLVIEPTKSEYRSLIDAIDELQIFTPGKSHVSPFLINPFIPPRGVTVESYVPSLMAAFKAAFSMINPLPDLFLAAINDCYNEYGWKSISTTDDPGVELFGLYEFVKVFKRKIQSMDYKGEVKSNIESAGVVRLVTLIEQNSNIYDTIHTIPLDDLLSKPTIIELNAINNKEQKSLIMALLLIQICVHTKLNVTGDGHLKNVMLIDEAHVLLSRSGGKSSDSADSQGSTVEALEDLIAEIRSYGTSIIIADQSPTKVGRSIIGNTNVKVIFKLVEKENKDCISSATNMSSADYDLLGRLNVGEAMLHYGRIHNPLHIKAYNLHDRAQIRSVITDDEIAAKSRYWESRKHLLIPYRECKYNCMCQHECGFLVKANADFLAARLINMHFYGIKDKPSFVKFLVGLDTLIDQLLKEIPSIENSLKLKNCVKIKFLRKAMLIKSFDLTKSEYQTILTHRNFLKKLEVKTDA